MVLCIQRLPSMVIYVNAFVVSTGVMEQIAGLVPHMNSLTPSFILIVQMKLVTQICS
jgi:hypothetical protein